MPLKPTVTNPLAKLGTSPGDTARSRTASSGWMPSHPVRSTRVSWARPGQQWPAHPWLSSVAPFLHAVQNEPVTAGLALSTNPCSLQATPNLLQNLGDNCKEPWPGTSRRPHRDKGSWQPAGRSQTIHFRENSGQGWVFPASILGSCRPLP